jgi:hypothetical protein
MLGLILFPSVTEISDAIHKRNDPLLGFLKSVYVDSKDPTEVSLNNDY